MSCGKSSVLCPMALSYVIWPCPVSYGPLLRPMARIVAAASSFSNNYKKLLHQCNISAIVMHSFCDCVMIVHEMRYCSQTLQVRHQILLASHRAVLVLHVLAFWCGLAYASSKISVCVFQFNVAHSQKTRAGGTGFSWFGVCVACARPNSIFAHRCEEHDHIAA